MAKLLRNRKEKYWTITLGQYRNELIKYKVLGKYLVAWNRTENDKYSRDKSFYDINPNVIFVITKELFFHPQIPSKSIVVIPVYGNKINKDEYIKEAGAYANQSWIITNNKKLIHTLKSNITPCCYSYYTYPTEKIQG